jgi:hypothetical protein
MRCCSAGKTWSQIASSRVRADRDPRLVQHRVEIHSSRHDICHHPRRPQNAAQLLQHGRFGRR